MSELLLCTILEGLFLVFSIIVIIQLIKFYIEKKNRIDLIIIAFVTMLLLHSIFRMTQLMNFPIDFIIGARLDRYDLTFLITITILLEFILYLKGLKKFYSLPPVISFYISIGLILVDNEFIFISFGVISGIIAFFVLFIDGKKNLNGNAMGIAIFTLLYVISEMSFFLGFNALIISLIRVVSITILLLGASGLLEKYILINKEEENEIKNIWISKMVIKEKD